MRPTLYVVPALLAAAALSLAQAQPPQTPAGDPKVDVVLGGWEKAMSGVQSLLAVIRRTSLDKTYQTTEVFTGQAKYVRSSAPNQPSRASLEMFKKGRPEIFEKYVCSGTYLYEFSPANQVIRIHELPKAKPGQIADDNFLSFVFGMKAADAKLRYQIEYQPPPANDVHYQYLMIMPRTPQDKADFTKARLVLWKETMLPRQLWFHQPNGNEVTWDFEKIISPAEIRLTEFAQPDLPKGWKWERAPVQAQPRVMRNSGK